ncbi:glycosyl hydrolase [Fomitopsis serialis]|uniref:glycosyl hydrolase n=1 Tax=Fomitopsis serialis TaxID=139415 RepID=UPI0020080FCC|nr:glycosyl hydrolase [Neoantrodia serialis]KAH9929715.1 glycosyl hydrolase [Neoantrodia serialis]
MLSGTLLTASLLSALVTSLPGALSLVLDKRAVAGPVIDHNFPDPGLIRTSDGVWYAYSTSSGGKNIPVATSRTSTPGHRDALPNAGDWVDSSDAGLWAPDVREITAGNYVMYYSVKPTSAAHRCVAAATATSPTGPFTAPSGPLFCDDNEGGVIDISGFEAPGGGLYIVWKVDGNSIGSSNTPIRLRHVGANGYTVEGDVYTLIDRSAADGPLVEAPSLVYWDGWYYLFFSSNVYSSTYYDISYAVSQSVTGPYTKVQAPDAPFLVTGDDGLTAPGGATVINVLNQHVNMVFHADLNGENTHGGRGMYSAASICLKGGVATVSC